MKRSLLAIVVLLIGIRANAQWTTTGPVGIITGLTLQGNSIFVSTDSGAYTTNNNGNSWQPTHNGITDKDLLAIASDGAQVVTASRTGHVFLLEPNSSVWAPRYITGLSENVNYYPKTILIYGDTILVGMAEGFGIYVSTNRGQGWVHPQSVYDEEDVNALVKSNGVIYAATNGGVLKSTDNGFTWTDFGNGLPLQGALSLAVDGQNMVAGTTMGLYKTTININSWQPANGNINSTIAGVNAVYLSGNNLLINNTYAADSALGVYSSITGGLTWNKVHNGFGTEFAYTFIKKGSTFYTYTYSGIYSSTDGGLNWAGINSPQLPVSNYNILALAASNGRVMAGGDYDFIFASDNNGNSWTNRNQGFTRYDSGVEGLFANDSIALMCSLDYVYTSTDNGNNWRLSTGPVYATRFMENNNVLYALGSGGLSQSTDKGNTWTKINTGFDVDQLAFHGNTFYTCPSHKLSYSTNWTDWYNLDISATHKQVNSIAMNGNILLVQSDNASVISVNGGTSWATVDAPFSYFYNPVFGNNHVFVSSDGNKLYGFNTNTTTWTDLTGNLPNTNIQSMAINGNTLFVGLLNRGIWQRSVADYVASLDNISAPAIQFNIYPNPTSQSFVVQTPVTGTQQLKITDLAGQLVLVQPVESTKTVINTTNLATGVYMISIKGAEGSATRKLIIER